MVCKEALVQWEMLWPLWRDQDERISQCEADALLVLRLPKLF